MKLLLLAACCVAISHGHVVPTVPGDNSHYVEGESRYIWMPNGEGVPVLVDLQEPVDHDILRDQTKNGANNQYWLFTRRNPTSAQIITHGNILSVWASNFDGSKETKVMVHGWTGNGNSPDNVLITSAFLAAEDVNVIVVDWRALAASNYATAVQGVPSVGQFLGNFLSWLVLSTTLSMENIHIVGHSLGAHVVGSAGRTTGGLVRRVTGLDPAGPSWGSSNPNTISPSDGVYVEIIHTDSGILGILAAVGDADFYPNRGINPQPGCSNSGCSHGRVVDLFAATIRFDHLPGFLCNSLSAAILGQCTGSTLSMGNNNVNKWGNGIFYLTTESSWPY